MALLVHVDERMDISKINEDIIDEIHLVLDQINKAETKALANHILRVRRIFICGAGESGIVAESFALRLLHIGLNANVIKKKIPKIKSSDLLIVISGSGETKQTLNIAKKSKANGAFVIAITEHKHSSLGKHANSIIEMKIKPKIKTLNGHLIEPEYVLFEQSAFIFLESVWIYLLNKMRIKPEKLIKRKKRFD